MMADRLDERQTKESCPSPRPMAFTVDFGPCEGGSEQEHKKKLALRDSIGRFAPAKVKKPATALVVAVGQQPSKDNTNHLATVKDEVMILDEENNIKNDLAEAHRHAEAVEVDAEAEVEPAVSDAGTYTIDDEEEDPKDDPDLDSHAHDTTTITESHRDKDIHRTFGVITSEKVSCSRAEWVSVWASNTFAEDNPIQEEDDLAEAERSSSSQRRRLPPTPSRQNGYQHKDNHDEIEEDTNEYLRDTISLMTAMEARISSSTEETALQQAATSRDNKQKEVNNIAGTPTKRRPKTGGGSSSELRKSANNAAAKAKEAKEKAAQQWQRRKNYDPLKSMTKSKPSTANSSRDYTDESSDVESAASFSQRGCRDNSGSSLQATNPRVALIRSDGGRHSLRGQKEQENQHQGHHHGGPQSLGSPVRRPPFRNNVMSQNGGRSTSSLSSKEAEFQAWKRRKNYNPMRSATASVTSSKGGTPSSPASVAASSSISHHRTSPKAVVSKTNSSTVASAPEDNGMTKIHKRSASFHYPDGTSRITHSVYSSEEDFNDDEDDDEPRLYEVNDDELFLAYDSGGVVAPRRHVGSNRRTPTRGSGGAGSTSSTQSGSKLEALDNLVISTIFSVSTKLCLLSGKLVKSVQERTSDKEEEAMLQTLMYVLEDIDPPVSPSKKTSRELAGTLRNLKKVEQALQTLERSETDL